ncbi:ABC transporter [Tsukamurella pulmonis]|uniref:Inner membrane protein YedI n=1 Tax=Tsukamurella pulmonis TaxID=47312 RepID=A0A1H1F775_9ACTN|nr:DUF808 domain-containing protein [Tsukamurella pulmonis]KXO88650.1 ABC transporter [Tsukamurella pulmonis]SDQ96727.1 hypothetical protein SAMN04489765_2555 [Tsukamurella pulmonis]SUP19987.1 Inner membrane protein yedI [Tsukamurella pulmonis]
MAGGLAALLDDIAALARLAAASVDDVAAAAGRASVKAAGVVVDDTAVTPRYVQGIEPARELRIVARIAKGSLRNKLVFILPAILLLSWLAPWALTPILMLGGTYLCYEGAEKIWEKLSGHEEPEADAGQAVDEDTVVSGAIRTDFILSAEIMVIAMNEVASEALWSRALILVVVAILITALVYGVVALIVKMDDVGLALAQRPSEFSRRVGTAMVKAMPKVLSVLANVGIVAMCWVGGHILLVGLDDLGWHRPYSVVHHFETWAHDLIPAIGSVLGWLANTLGSALFGLAVGAVVVAIVHLIGKIRGGAPAEH